ncbi:MAG: PAS domain S-box protein [Fibrobacterota bacterium]
MYIIVALFASFLIQIFLRHKNELSRKLGHQNKLLSGIRNVNQLITHEKDKHKLLKEACRLLVENRGFFNAWAVLTEKEKSYGPFYYAGLRKSEFEKMAKNLNSGKIPLCAAETLGRSGIKIIRHPHSECGDCPLSPEYKDRSGLTIRLEHENIIFGWLSVSVPRKYADDLTEHELFEEVAGDISYALWSIDNENKRREAGEKFETVLSETSDGIVASDLSGKITLFNPGAEKLFECRAEEVIGTNISRFCPEELLFSQKKLLKKALENRTARSPFETERVTAHGKRFPVEMTVSVNRDTKGNPQGISSVIRDISKRKEIQDKLSANEENLRITLNSIGDAVISTDINGNVVKMNRVAQKLTGWSVAEASGKPLTEVFRIINAKTGLPSEDPVKKVLETKKIIGLANHTVLISKSGEKFQIADSAAPIKDEPGSIKGVVLVFRDVTEEYRIREELRESEERKDLALRAGELGTWDWDITSGRVVFSERWAEMQGYSLEEIKSDISSWENLLHPDDEARVKDLLQQHLEGRIEIYSSEHRLRHKSGSWVWILDKGKIIERDENGNPLRMCGTHMDVSEAKKAEEMLKKTEAKYRQIFENIQDVYYEASLDGRILEISPSIESISEYKREELLGASLEKIYRDPEERANLLKAFSLEGKVTDYEVNLKDKSGESRYCSITASVVISKENKTLKISGTMRDITERRKTLKQLKESETRFKTIIEDLPVAVFAHDLDGKFVLVNTAASKNTGYTKTELSEMSVYDLDPESLDRKDREKLWNYLRVGRSEVLEGKHIRKDGSSYPAEIHLCGIFLDGKQVILAMAFDISTRKKAEEESIRLTSAINQAAETIVITDTDGKIQYVNPAFENTTGYKETEAIGKNPRILKSGEQDRFFYKQLWETILSGNTWTGRMVNRKKDGSFYTEECVISPVRSPAGKIVNFVAVKRDISREIQLEKQLRQSEKMEAIGHLAGGIAHDFNNILAGIIGFSEISLSMVSPGSRMEKNILRIKESGNRAKELVNQILLFSRQGPEELSPIYIRPIIKEAVHLLKASLPSSIEIKTNLAREDKPVLADPTKIHEILMNLCTNASSAMNEKGLLEIGFADEYFDREWEGRAGVSKPGFYSVLTVKDNGNGIPEELMPRIFEPFFTTREPGEGTGMGLAVVFGIIQSHKGNITVESGDESGTVFKVFLPKTNASLDIAKEPKCELIGGTESILFVDDEEILTDMVSSMLTELGYKVKSFNNSEKALESFRENPAEYDLVITDQTMPNMTGLEMSREILKIRPGTPIILCTGYSRSVNEEKARKEGIKGFYLKPLNRKDFSEIIRNIMDE